MIKTIVKAKSEILESVFEELKTMIENLDARKEEKIKLAIEEVEKSFENESKELQEVFASVSITEEIEVPDEEPVVEATETEVQEEPQQSTQESLY